MKLTTKRAQALRVAIKKAWEANLIPFGIKYPEGLAPEPGLLALFEAMPSALTQQELTDFYKNNTDITYNMQLRHFASKGLDIRSGNPRFSQGLQDRTLKSDQLRLAQIKLPHSNWLASDKLKRSGSISKLSWDQKLERYRDHGCCVCGQKFETYDKGHLDPHKGYTDDNIFPMCPPCNNWAQDRVAFKMYGMIARPIYIREKLGKNSK
jgi:hypothetical protein